MKTKTALSVLIIVLIATTPVLCTSGCGEKLTAEEELTEENGLTVDEITEQIRQKEAGIQDYSYTIQVASYVFGKTQEGEIRVLLKKPDREKIFVKEPGKEEMLFTVSDGEFMWTCNPMANTVMKVEIQDTPAALENRLHK